jgi:hypothetical protein
VPTLAQKWVRRTFRGKARRFVGGLTFGKITGFAAESGAFVDAFFIAPDHSRAGLIWVISATDYFRRLCPSPSTRTAVAGIASIEYRI